MNLPGLDERRYYQLDVDMGLGGAPLRVWTNEKRLMEGFSPDPDKPFRGLVFSEPPKIAFDRRKQRGSLRDADTMMLGIWLVADRVKALFERIDPDGFAFARAEVDYSNFDAPGPEFWFCDIVRLLDCVDEEQSKLTYYNNVPFKAYKSLIDVKMRPEAVGLAHAFRLKKANLTQVVDDTIATSVKMEKIRGFRFVDIQYP